MPSINPTPISPMGGQTPSQEKEKTQKGKDHGKIYTAISNALQSISDTIKKIKKLISGKDILDPNLQKLIASYEANRESLKQLHVIIIGAKELLDQPQKNEKPLTFKELRNLDSMAKKLSKSINALEDKLKGVRESEELNQAKIDMQDLSSLLQKKQEAAKQKQHAALEKQDEAHAEKRAKPSKIDMTSKEARLIEEKLSTVLGTKKLMQSFFNDYFKFTHQLDNIIHKALAIRQDNGQFLFEISSKSINDPNLEISNAIQTLRAEIEKDADSVSDLDLYIFSSTMSDLRAELRREIHKAAFGSDKLKKQIELVENELDKLMMVTFMNLLKTYFGESNTDSYHKLEKLFIKIHPK